MTRASLTRIEVRSSSHPDDTPQSLDSAGELESLSKLSARSSGFVPGSSSRAWSSSNGDASAIIDEFTEQWDRGENPRIEEFLDRITPASRDVAVELIYRQYCLEEADGFTPDPELYLDRFAEFQEPLDRLFRLHTAVTGSQLRRWTRLDDEEDADEELFGGEPELPIVGDRIGPFVLRRELGRGTFAKVFLAEQSDLEDRQVVVKITSRPSREPWLLARIRHPHIVEIIARFEVDGGSLQLITMPFVGGAALSSVLARIRERPFSPRSGIELLSDLDSVSAPEYPERQRSEEWRRLVARSTYTRALGWMIARLAEALDHASTRKVAHGDIKPSNILISADARPMLLDFNLAQDWTSADEMDSGPADRGGTLAYMAPERLDALSVPASILTPHRPHDPHRADIYSLGMVLLEALSHQSAPVDLNRVTEPGPRTGPVNLREAAARMARHRGQTSARDLIHQATGDHVRIPSGLRAILECCLDPDPARRYPRGQILADDLDRWRTGRPLAFASEPPLQAAYRLVAAKRFPLIAATVVLLATFAGGTSVAYLLNSRTVQTLARISIEKLSHWWDAPETRAFGFPRIHLAADRLVSVPASNDDPPEDDLRPELSRSARIRPEVVSRTIENATLALRDYQVLEAADWRTREDVRHLPPQAREDLELWLMEQAYRYCADIANRPDSPDDWERALVALDRLESLVPLTAFRRLRQRVARAINDVDLRQPVSSSSHAEDAETIAPKSEKRGEHLSDSSTPLEEFLLGVALECSADDPSSALAERLDLQSGSSDERALTHYRVLISNRPDSFWAHYRAAVVSQRLGRTRDMTEQLSECLRLRPSNPAVHAQLASSLFMQHRLDEALTVCNRAIELDPERAEYHRTRAFIDADLGRSEEIRADLHRFEVLSRALPQSLLRTRFRPVRGSGEELTSLHLVDDPARAGSRVASAGDPPALVQGRSVIDLEDLDTRLNLARSVFIKSKDFAQAIAELDKILILDPNYLHARIFKATYLAEARALDEVQREISLILKNPRLPEFVQEQPDTVTRFIDIAWLTMSNKRYSEARDLSRKALNFALSVDRHKAISYYTVARAISLTTKDQLANRPALINEAAEHLALAYSLTETASSAPSRFRQWYKQDPSFHPIRQALDAALNQRSGHVQQTMMNTMLNQQEVAPAQ